MVDESKCTVIVSYGVREDGDRFLDDAFRSATKSQDFRDASGRLVPFPIHASAYEIVRT